jgi:hypothetical protein
MVASSKRWWCVNSLSLNPTPPGTSRTGRWWAFRKRRAHHRLGADVRQVAQHLHRRHLPQRVRQRVERLADSF